MNNRNLPQAQRAFTLIELLVVIAIIAILAAILFPVFAQVRAQARKTTCLSNVKQTSLAVLMYAQDYDETIPLVFARDTTNPEAYRNPWAPNRPMDAWQNLVQPYVKGWQVFICPDSGATRSDPRTAMDPFLSYAIFPNSGIAGAPFWTDNYYNRPQVVMWQGIGGFCPDTDPYGIPSLRPSPSWSLARIAAPATMSLTIESGAPDGWIGFLASPPNTAFDYGMWFPSSQSMGGYIPASYLDSGGTHQFGPQAYHLSNGGSIGGHRYRYWGLRDTAGQTVFSCVDGHARTMPLKQYMAPKTAGSGQLVYPYLWPEE